MRNFSQLQSLVQAATPANSAGGLTAGEIVNLAGRYLFQLHEWQFLVRQSTTLGVTSDQSYVELPADFDTLVAINSATFNKAFALVPYSDLLAYKRSQATYTQTFAALVWPDQASGNTAPPTGPRLELFPVPTATISGAILLVYNVKWRELTKPDQVPNMPAYMELLFLSVLRAVAAGFVDGTLDDRIEKIKGGALFRTAADKDGSQSPFAGPITNTAVQTASNRPAGKWWDSAIPNPS